VRVSSSWPASRHARRGSWLSAGMKTSTTGNYARRR
jgi:hypothetical protein